jgi:hypothetical protein
LAAPVTAAGVLLAPCPNTPTPANTSRVLSNQLNVIQPPLPLPATRSDTYQMPVPTTTNYNNHYNYNYSEPLNISTYSYLGEDDMHDHLQFYSQEFYEQ